MTKEKTELVQKRELICARCGSRNIKEKRSLAGMDASMKAKLGQIYVVKYECTDCGSWSTKRIHPLVRDILNYFEDSPYSSKTQKG